MPAPQANIGFVVIGVCLAAVVLIGTVVILLSSNGDTDIDPGTLEESRVERPVGESFELDENGSPVRVDEGAE